MTALIDLLTGDLGKWLAGALLTLFTAIGLYAKGRSDANQAADRKADKDALQTHERINEAHHAKTPDDARAAMRDHADRLRTGRKP